MTIHDAKKFITMVRSDKQLRSILNSFSTSEEIFHFLEENNFTLDGDEFFEAHSYCLANARSSEEYSELQELLQWWNMLTKLS